MANFMPATEDVPILTADVQPLLKPDEELEEAKKER
jgi:hypothetical protein